MLRALLKRHLPAPIRQWFINARERLAPPIDDVVLAEYRPLADHSTVRRLGLVIPNLSAATAFGGVMTGLDIFFALAARLRAQGAWDLRVLLTEPGPDTDPSIALKVAERHGISSGDLAFERLPAGTADVAMRRGDVLIAYNWWCALNVRPLLEGQAAHFGIARRPLLYLIQEYEPNFYPFSSAHMLAREAYDGVGRLWGLFNSSNLFRWFEHLGHRAERSFVFEPVVSEALRPFLARAGDSQRSKRIVVYGRPNVARNCFGALVRGLNAWIEQDADHAGWEIVSAGTPHAPVRLAKGHSIRSLGKLPLDAYAELMLTSSVGVSLMASPHPSYPPLEMAHFGLRTVTNGYFAKDLGGWHGNIVSTAAISADALGEAIAKACALSKQPEMFADNPGFVRADPYPFLGDLAAAIEGEF